MEKVFVLRIGHRVSLPFSRRFIIVAPALLAGLLWSSVTALGMGGAAVDMADVLSAMVLSTDELGRQASVLTQFRLPRVGVAVLAGAMIAASGYLLQVVSRNGLADPGILGLSDGATVAVLAAGLLLGVMPASVLSVIALAGALATALVVLGLGHRFMDGGGSILIGLSISIVLGAVVEMIVLAGTPSSFAQLMIWSRGTLAAADGSDLSLLAQWFCVLLPLLLFSSRALRPMTLGSETAMALGVRARAMAIFYVLVATALAAPVVAVCGPIAFIGLMSSYVARALVGGRPTEILLVAMLAGAAILLWADTLGRWMFSPVSISAGLMVSVVGAPVFILSARLGKRAARSQ
ncbi:MAG: iron ABC transporter permease [Rhodocyclaceae bacterium]